MSVDKTIFLDRSWGDTSSRILIHSLLQQALLHLKFFEPTPIQHKAIPVIQRGTCDLVGAAETGSGKTLAYGIPILNRLLWDWNSTLGKACPFALILAPTRELALQIAGVLRSVCEAPSLKSQYKVEVVTVIGGMSEHKQRRQLSGVKPVHILVATPGRLCDMLLESDASVPALECLAAVRFLVVDEVDRMIEDGHFPELQKIFGVVREHEQIVARGETPNEVKRLRLLGTDEDEGVEGMDGEEADTDGLGVRVGFPGAEDRMQDKVKRKVKGNVKSVRQTLLFSATALATPGCNTDKGKKRRQARLSPDSVGVESDRLSPSLLALLKDVAVQQRFEVVDVATNSSATSTSAAAASVNGKEVAKTNTVAGAKAPKSALQLPSGLEQLEVRRVLLVMSYY